MTLFVKVLVMEEITIKLYSSKIKKQCYSYKQYVGYILICSVIWPVRST